MRASRTGRRGEDSSRQGLSVLCDDETLNTERTEHLRDLSSQPIMLLVLPVQVRPRELADLLA